MRTMKLWAWRKFLRIGHDLIWKAEEWFQREEVKIRNLEETYESIDGKHESESDSQRARIQTMGRRDGEGDSFRRADESAGNGRSRTENTVRHRIDGVAEIAGTERSRRVRAPRRKLTAADFDRKMGMMLAKTRPAVQA